MVKQAGGRPVKTYEDPAKHTGDGQGGIIQKERIRNRMDAPQGRSNIVPILAIIVIILFALSLTNLLKDYELVVISALILGVLILGSMLIFVSGLKGPESSPGSFDSNEPKLIVDNTGQTKAPFVDGTGSRAGALFGDVRHDPLQSGGLGNSAALKGRERCCAQGKQRSSFR